MTKSNKSERVKKLVHMQGGRSAPRASRFVPEIRSDHKWSLGVGKEENTAPFRQLLIAWYYGVDFAEIEKFHTFLKDNEKAIDSNCTKLMPNVFYRGTYLDQEGGSPTYQTIWAYDSVDALRQWNTVLDKDKLKSETSKSFYNAVLTLRSYWARDPGRSEHRYRLASLYSDLKTLAGTDPFLAITLAGLKRN